MSGKRTIFPATILTCIAVLICNAAAAEDRYDAAVNHAGRSAADIERDPKDKPASVLRLTGIGPGMHVVDVTDGPPKTDAKSVLDQIARALKPGGVLLVVDHSAKAGTGSADADSLHRIDEVFARRDIESHGFKLIAHTDILRDPSDDRTKISYKPPALGRTDRFVYIFRKVR
jgi:predicted methyltransferase